MSSEATSIKEDTNSRSKIILMIIGLTIPSMTVGIKEVMTTM